MKFLLEKFTSLVWKKSDIDFKDDAGSWGGSPY